MKLTILGTGNAAVSECYNTCFALKKGEEYFLTEEELAGLKDG